jgi:hypothetical protein
MWKKIWYSALSEERKKGVRKEERGMPIGVCIYVVESLKPNCLSVLISVSPIETRS